MVIGDLVRFKYHYEITGRVHIRKGDLGLIKEKEPNRYGIYHFRTSETIYLKEYNLRILEEL